MLRLLRTRQRLLPLRFHAVWALLLGCSLTGGCISFGDDPQDTPAQSEPVAKAIDAFDEQILAGGLSEGDRILLYTQRWSAVQRAVVFAGLTQGDAFYASRAYWHTGFIRGGRWAWDEPSDLNESVSLSGRGGVLIRGDCNADITASDGVVIHILGDLNATITTQSSAEIVIAGMIGPSGAIESKQQLDLFTGGAMHGRIVCGGSTLIHIDDDAHGQITAGQPSTTIHITGDLLTQLTAAQQGESLLSLRIDGYLSAKALLDAASSGFTRVNASLGVSDVPPGVYPAGETPGERSVLRWVVHTQRE